MYAHKYINIPVILLLINCYLISCVKSNATIDDNISDEPACFGGYEWFTPLEGELSEYHIETLLSVSRSVLLFYKSDWALRQLINHGEEENVIDALFDATSSSDIGRASTANIALFALGFDNNEIWESILQTPSLIQSPCINVITENLDIQMDQDKILQLLDIDPVLVYQFPSLPDVVPALISQLDQVGQQGDLHVYYNIIALGALVNYDETYRCDSNILEKLYEISLNWSGGNKKSALTAISLHGPCLENEGLLRSIWESDNEYEVRIEALEGLVKITEKESTLSLVCEAFADIPAYYCRDLLKLSIDKYGSNPQLIESVISVIKSERDDSVAAFYTALMYFGTAANGAVSVLIKQLNEGKIVAAYALGCIQSNPEEVIPLLTHFFDPEYVDIDALAKSDFITSQESGLAIAAMQAMSLMGDDAQEFIPILAQIAETTSGEVQTAALNSLCNLDEDGDIAIPLLNRLQTSSGLTGLDALIHLRLFLYGNDKQAHAEAVYAILDNQQNKGGIDEAVWALSYMGEYAEFALPHLEEMANQGQIGTSRGGNPFAAISQVKDLYEPPFNMPVLPYNTPTPAILYFPGPLGLDQYLY